MIIDKSSSNNSNNNSNKSNKFPVILSLIKYCGLNRIKTNKEVRNIIFIYITK